LKHLANDPDLSDEWKKSVLQIREKYFDYLRGYPSNIGDNFWKERPTREKILNSVLHTLDHTKSYDNREEFDKLACDEIRATVLMQAFTNIIMNIFKLICIVSDLNEKELRSHYPEIELGDLLDVW
jgi:hypothetical protein